MWLSRQALHSWALLVALFVCGTRAYVPAVPTNDTVATSQRLLALDWSTGTDGIPVSYELMSNQSFGIDKGVLVHYSEKTLTSAITITPWIAFISCDANETTDFDVDIFTVIQPRGAVAAVLYSQYSNGCLINEEFQDPELFSPILDVFSLTQLSATQFVQATFRGSNATYNFDAGRLNSTNGEVTAALNSGSVPPNATFMIASIVANTTNDSSDQGGGSSANGTPSGSGSSSKKGPSSLAMIVLYVITGCVSLLFCVVILSGAIRAIRNPDRYGPRPADPTMGPDGIAQTRTTGLTRAILDTFPVIKFAMPSAVVPQSPGAVVKPVDAENVAETEGLPLEPLEPHSRRSWVDLSAGAGSGIVTLSTTPNNDNARGSEDRSLERSSATVPVEDNDGVAAPKALVVPDMPAEDDNALGRDLCPICMMDFEEGDDLRVLPCQGQHRFHPDCVDPWLLESSGTCPLCREDFHAPDDDDEYYDGDMRPAAPRISAYARMSRFLRFPRRRQSAAPSPPSVATGPSRSPSPEMPADRDE